jgi:hypothetical protein
MVDIDRAARALSVHEQQHKANDRVLKSGIHKHQHALVLTLSA